MNILCLISNYDGCGYFRTQLVAKYLNRMPNVRVKISVEYNKNLFDWADVIVLQKQLNQAALPFLKYASNNKKLLVYEVDDDYFNIPTWNPAYKHYQGDKPKEIINFYKASNVMTVTTKHLAEQLSKYNSNIHVLPNSIDFPFLDRHLALFEEASLRDTHYLDNKSNPISSEKSKSYFEGRKVIGWGGSPTHSRDLEIVAPVLQQICSEDKNVTVVMMACSIEDIVNKLPEDQLILVRPEPIFNYIRILPFQKWDVGICPIEDNLFNRSKSNLKYLEFGSLGFSCVCSNVENYSNTVTHMENGLLTENTQEDWYKNIKMLLEDKELSKKIGNNAKRYVREKFDMSKNYIRWYDLYKSQLELVRKG